MHKGGAGCAGGHRLGWTFAAVVTAAALTGVSRADVIYMHASVSTSRNGQSWATAKKPLTEALAVDDGFRRNNSRL